MSVQNILLPNKNHIYASIIDAEDIFTTTLNVTDLVTDSVICNDLTISDKIYANGVVNEIFDFTDCNNYRLVIQNHLITAANGGASLGQPNAGFENLYALNLLGYQTVVNAPYGIRFGATGNTGGLSPTALTYYGEETFTLPVSGYTVPIDATVISARIGKNVTFSFSFSGTATIGGVNTDLNFTLPASLTPSVSINVPVVIINNGVRSYSLMTINNNGVCSIFADINFTLFLGATNNCGIVGVQSASYNIV